MIVSFLSCKRKEYTSGQAVFEGECVKCHVLNGKGGKKGPDLTTVFQQRDEEFVRTYVQYPRLLKPDSVMPGAKLSDPELDFIVQYLKEKGR